ncbi:G2/mitotic-specific cyclin-A-like [Gordionus sp. m RMFG-2023]|uniref:G2/mitotic-specific cyclin-A-like n=1 Tax=Gordionus sp. m RMFG-2023 TaxID=3053472 RepID=UPI0031FC9A72
MLSLTDDISEYQTLDSLKNSPMVIADSEILPLSNDIYNIPEYAQDILLYLKELESLHKPRPTYMTKQPDITYMMRATVVDWLVEVSVEYKLLDKTLFLACSYIDRFLSIMAISRNKLQLLGTTSMFIAAKFEEIYPPDINEFVYITDGTYSKEQVVRMEQLILKILSFRVGPPTVICFLEKFCKLAGLPKTVQNLAKYLSELTLLDGEVYLKYEPSIIASSAICLSNMTFQREPWGMSLQKYSGYAYTHFLSCLKDIYHTMCAAQQNQQHKAICQKFMSNKYEEVSKILPPPPYNLLVKD